jgi:nucleotide-binding universal stress UspA family protein
MKPSKSILVGLKTAEHVDELMGLAVRLAEPSGSILIVHVIELPDPTPLDADVPQLDAVAKGIIQNAERIALQHGMKAGSEVVRAHSAAAAMLDEMKKHEVDLAIVGYHHGRTFGEFLLGTTAQHLARNAPCRVLLSIPPR